METDFSAMTINQLAELCTREYSEISLREKRLEQAKKVLFELMSKTNTEEVKSPFGRFYRKVVTSWTMPDDVVALKAKLTEAEEMAKNEGRALKTEKYTYSYGALKKDEQI